MVQVVWTRGAATDLRAIRAYVAQFSPLAAQKLAARLFAAARGLETSPDRGRPIAHDRRELAVIPPYLIRYVHRNEQVVVLEVRHGARRPD